MTPPSSRPRSNWPIIAIFLITLLPIVMAALAYYVPALGLRSAVQTHYGQLIEPQRPIPDTLVVHDDEGRPFDLKQLKGKWLLISAGPGACPETCVRGLFVLRNAHASQGKNVLRLERIWFVTDQAPVAAFVHEAYRGTRILRADAQALARWLTPEASAAPQALAQGLWIVDPLGHLMMQFPDGEKPEAIRDDIKALLKNSQIG